jgi:anti-sigma regulatory factor (Ser/Thr protein kinase)
MLDSPLTQVGDGGRLQPRGAWRLDARYQEGGEIRMSEANGSATIVAFRGPDHLNRVRRIAAFFAESAGMDREEREEVALVVTEACVNAMRHGSPNGLRDNVVVSFQAFDHTITAQVADFGGVSPIPGTADGPEPGYGLRLMQELCDDVAYARSANGLTLRLTKRARSTSASPVP